MELGAVFPHNEIGSDAGAIRAYAQGVEALGATHLLIYDHVLGADPNRPGGFRGPYDKDIAFHEPLTTFAYLAGVTDTLEFVCAVLILPQRQTVLVAKQAAEVAVLSGNRFRLGVGTGWNEVEYEGLNKEFSNRGKRQAEQVDLLRRLWMDDVLTYHGDYHTITAAGINPRPSKPIPVWFGGSAPALLRRCAVLGDGWIPQTGANDATRESIDTIRTHREVAGLSWEGFGIQARAEYAGGSAARWQRQASKWKKLGATPLAVTTHNAGMTNADGHVARVREYLEAVRG